MNLASPRVISEILKRRGLRPRRRLGQNFLVDANLLEKVAQAGDLRAEDSILEIGPGLGSLTRVLAAKARKVLAIEIDPGLYAALTEETVADLPHVQILRADFLELDLEQRVPELLGSGRHPVVANIPYSITSPVVIRLLEHPCLFDRIVLMVQREVADRLTAVPGTSDYGSLTLFVYLHADARKIAPVSRHAFLPPPEVDSAIVRLDMLPRTRYPDLDPQRYLDVVHAVFRQRRKNLLNALTGPPLNWSREQARRALEATGVDPSRRGETLSAGEFAALVRHWPAESGKDTRIIQGSTA